MSMHIWLRNGFPAFLIFGLWIKPPCRLSIAVLNFGARQNQSGIDRID
jgi:hypothetical protein